jgi:hypothetical protein
MNRDSIGFTLDLRKLVSVAAQDPKCRAEIIAGLQGPAEPLTSQLGAANIKEHQDAADAWCSVFPATVQGKQSGEQGLFYRNDAKGSARGAGDGDRIQMRLKKQPKQEQYAQSPQTYAQQGQVQTPAVALPQQQVDAATLIAAATADPVGFAQLLAQAAAQPAPAAPVVAQAQPQPQPVGVPELPPDIINQLNNAG